MDHVVLVLIAGVIRKSDCIFRVRAVTPIRRGASLRDRHSTRCVRIVVDRPLIAFSGLTLRHTVVLLGHYASISIHHSDWATMATTLHLIKAVLGFWKIVISWVCICLVVIVMPIVCALSCLHRWSDRLIIVIKSICVSLGVLRSVLCLTWDTWYHVLLDHASLCKVCHGWSLLLLTIGKSSRCCLLKLCNSFLQCFLLSHKMLYLV